MIITNNHGVSLTLAIWLINDDYDYNGAEQYISVTALMRPLRQIILPRRLDQSKREADVIDYVARAMGNSLHDSIEKAWTKNYFTNLIKLGYSEDMIERVLINPTSEELIAKQDPIPIYIEQRATRKFKNWTIGGKFDIVAEGILQDNKSTSAWTWVYGGRDNEHQLQGSLYRWLNPDKITEDFVRINYIFTDWSKANLGNPKYPRQRVESKDILLLDITESESWILNKLSLIEKYMEAPEKEIPECTSEELWMSDPAYKYYADPTKVNGRSTKNFDSLSEAQIFIQSKGGKGIIKTIPGEPKRCGYCDAFDACSQKDKYFHD